jgi:ribosomal protein L37E
MDRYRTPTVSLAEAYHVAQRWLTFLGAVPEQITEPADGIIELRSSGLVTRIKFDRTAVAPSAILAMLKATDGEAVRRLLFSVTGFTDGAKSLGESRGFGLFDIDAIGDVHPHTTYARSLVPKEPLEPAFLHSPTPEEDAPAVPVNPFGPVEEDAESEWIDCPRCGVTQHHSVEVCVSCGADVTVRGRISSGSPQGVVSQSPLTTAAKPSPLLTQPPAATPVPPSTPGSGPRLRCRTCGSHDIELQHGG